MRSGNSQCLSKSTYLIPSIRGMYILKRTIKHTLRSLGLELHRFSPASSKIARLMACLDHCGINMVLDIEGANDLALNSDVPRSFNVVCKFIKVTRHPTITLPAENLMVVGDFHSMAFSLSA